VGCYPKTKEEFHNEKGQFGTDPTAVLIQKWEEAAKLPEELETRTVFLRLGLVIMSSAGLLSKILPYLKWVWAPLWEQEPNLSLDLP